MTTRKFLGFDLRTLGSWLRVEEGRAERGGGRCKEGSPKETPMMLLLGRRGGWRGKGLEIGFVVVAGGSSIKIPRNL